MASLADKLLTVTLTADQLESGKECCRSILEEVKYQEDLDWVAWQAVCHSLALASLSLDNEKKPEDFADVSIDTIAPRFRYGKWSIDNLANHPRSNLLCEELMLLRWCLAKLQNTDGFATSVIWDVDALVAAMLAG